MIKKKLNQSNVILDLGMHPYADTFIRKSQINKSEPIFPLKCLLNPKTGMISNLIKTNDSERYNLYDYSYTSSNSLYAKNYWKSYFKDILAEVNISNKTKILEIGSNDGFLLSLFKKKTKKVIGVDASKTMCKIAKKNQIKTLNLIMNKANAKKIKNKHGKFDLIIANNVINHANSVDDFIKGIKEVMHYDSIFIFEVPYWLDLVIKKKFDQIYHEHISYFTAKFSKSILSKNKMGITKIEKTDYHGGSIRVFSKLTHDLKIKKNHRLDKMIELEENKKLFSKNYYKIFMKEINEKKFKLLKKILIYKSKGYRIVGIGAAAKANTFINFLGVNSLIIDFITDTSKFKIGKLTPMSRIPIYNDNKLKNIKKVCAILFAWNISHILKKKIQKINKKAKFLNF